MIEIAHCRYCGGKIEDEIWAWIHVSTADRECWGYPYYGNRLAIPELSWYTDKL